MLALAMRVWCFGGFFLVVEGVFRLDLALGFRGIVDVSKEGARKTRRSRGRVERTIGRDTRVSVLDYDIKK